MSSNNIPKEIGLKTDEVIGNKIDWNELTEDTTPQRIKYRIINGRKVEDYRRNIFSSKVGDTEIVLQSTYSLAGKGLDKRFLATFGVGSCVVATLYDSSSKTGTMVHFDNRSNVIAAMKEIKKRLGGNPQDWQLRIVGGYRIDESSKAIVKNLRREAAFSKIPIMEEDILEGFQRGDIAVALDTETGELLDLSTNYTDSFTQKQKDAIGKKLGQIVSDPMIAIGKVEFLPNLFGEK